MALGPGARLGPYEITAQIGKGGMGEVYRARDTRLKRDVAIKVLPDALTVDAERLARFQREAELLAALNHPNIAHLYGIEEMASGASAGLPASRALIMEVVDGPTLAERINDGPIPLDEALHIARQIAEALEAAHAQGIVHRDLKPGNVKVRPDGTVKVLDFGLAKAVEPAGATGGASEAPTVTTPVATQAGLAVGTPAYMSPEQVQGRAVDAQADIWAFGATLYEMVSGRRPFVGETMAETLASVQKSEPDWTVIDSRLTSLLRWCLQKDRKRRLHDIRDARALLEEQSPTPVAVPARPLPVWILAAGVLLLLTVVSLAWLLFGSRGDTGTSRFAYVDIALPPGTGLASSAYGSTVAISRDGAHVAFVGETGGESAVWIRTLDVPLARRLENTAGAAAVFWAPDSRNLGFYASGTLRRIDIETGVARDVAAVPVFRGATWGGDDTILYGRLPGGLMVVDASGGEPAPVTETSTEEQFHYYPSYFPDGRRFLYSTETGVWVGSTDDAPRQDNRTRVLELPTSAAYAPVDDGRGALLFTRGSTLYGQRFAQDSMKLTGPPVAIADAVGTGNLQRRSPFSASATGSLVTSPFETSPANRIVRVSPSGDLKAVVGEQRAYASVSPSVEGASVLALTLAADFAHLGVLALDRGAWSQLATAGIYPYFVWSPDGREVAYTSLRDGPSVIRVRANGERASELLGGDMDLKSVWDWTEAGLVFSRRRSDTQFDLELLPSDGSAARQLVADGAYNLAAQVSPDRRWLAYVSNASGRDQVYLQPFPDANGRREPVSLDGGTMPLWNGDGTWIYFQAPSGRLMAVDVTISGDDITLGSPKPLFDVTVTSTYAGARTWSYRPDLDEFLVIRSAPFSTPSLRLTLDWSRLLAEP